MPIQSRFSANAVQVCRVSTCSRLDDINDDVISHTPSGLRTPVVGVKPLADLVVFVVQILVHWVPEAHVFDGTDSVAADDGSSSVELEPHTIGVNLGGHKVIPVHVPLAFEERIGIRVENSSIVTIVRVVEELPLHSLAGDVDVRRKVRDDISVRVRGAVIRLDP